MADRFYMACLRDTVGSNMSFHCRNGQGYASDINKAHVYTLEEAQNSWNRGRDIDLPVSADAIDAAAVWHVDHQHIPGESVLEEGCERYVAFVKGRWNGNDVYWLSDLLPTDDFSKARIFAESPDTNHSDLVWLPFTTADAVKRRTFNINLLDHRTMIQGAGLRQPDWFKRQKRRKSSGKTRWNCPYCGKISWQENPYDFDGCRDWACEGHR